MYGNTNLGSKNSLDIFRIGCENDTIFQSVCMYGTQKRLVSTHRLPTGFASCCGIVCK